MNKIAITSNFLAFLLFLFEKFSLLDSDPHIEFRSGYWMLILIQEVKWMRIRIYSPDFFFGCTIGWVNMYQIVDFSTFSYLSKLIYIQKSRNKQIFADLCKIRGQKLKTVRIFSQGPVQKRLKIESQFFAAMLFGPNNSKMYFMFTFIKNQVLMILS